MVGSKSDSTWWGAAGRCLSLLYLHFVGCGWLLWFSSSSIHSHFSSLWHTIPVDGMLGLVGMNCYAILWVPAFRSPFVLCNSYFDGSHHTPLYVRWHSLQLTAQTTCFFLFLGCNSSPSPVCLSIFIGLKAALPPVGCILFLSFC